MHYIICRYPSFDQAVRRMIERVPGQEKRESEADEDEPKSMTQKIIDWWVDVHLNSCRLEGFRKPCHPKIPLLWQVDKNGSGLPERASWQGDKWGGWWRSWQNIQLHTSVWCVARGTQAKLSGKVGFR